MELFARTSHQRRFSLDSRGSAPASPVSGPAQRSLTLQPATSPSRLKRPSTPEASAASLPPLLLRLLPGGANQFPGDRGSLSRGRVWLVGVLLDHRPSLLALRRWFPILVRTIPRYHYFSPLCQCVTPRWLAPGSCGPSLHPRSCRSLRTLWGSSWSISSRNSP